MTEQVIHQLRQCTERPVMVSESWYWKGSPRRYWLNQALGNSWVSLSLKTSYGRDYRNLFSVLKPKPVYFKIDGLCLNLNPAFSVAETRKTASRRKPQPARARDNVARLLLSTTWRFLSLEGKAFASSRAMSVCPTWLTPHWAFCLWRGRPLLRVRLCMYAQHDWLHTERRIKLNGLPAGARVNLLEVMRTEGRYLASCKHCRSSPTGSFVLCNFPSSWFVSRVCFNSSSSAYANARLCSLVFGTPVSCRTHSKPRFPALS